jgi:CO dehydrogenase maturation factor
MCTSSTTGQPDHEHPHAHQHSHPLPRCKAPLRIAIVGKGGAGKTTIAGALARVLAARGLRVLAVDADPDANLASALPLDTDRVPLPLAQQHELLHQANEHLGVPEGLFLLNPDTGSLLPQCTANWGGGNPLVALGWGKAGGDGCYCAEHALLRRLLAKASTATADVTLIDSEAGLEHLARGTIAGVDVVLIVIEPGRRSLETAAAVRELAASLDIAHVHCVISNYRSAGELDTLLGWLKDSPPLAAFPFDENVRDADLGGFPPLLAGEFLHAAEHLADHVLALERAE